MSILTVGIDTAKRVFAVHGVDEAGKDHLDERIKQYDVHIRSMARQCTAAKRLMQLMGVGEVTATAIVAMVGNASEFDSGRQFAAWLGQVPGQYSSGGKARLGPIKKLHDRL